MRSTRITGMSLHDRVPKEHSYVNIAYKVKYAQCSMERAMLGLCLKDKIRNEAIPYLSKNRKSLGKGGDRVYVKVAIICAA